MNKYIFLFFLPFTSLLAFDIAIDVGHTDRQEGAQSCRCIGEYHYNKNLVDFLQQSLVDERINIDRLMLKNPTFEQRYNLSRGKDLFVSIHHDSVQPRYITKNESGCPNTNYANGFSVFVSRKNPFFIKSLEYAQKFSEKLIEAGYSPSLHHAESISGENRVLLDPKLGIYLFDNLKVLKHASSPAFLFEAGVIVNPIDEQRVLTQSYYEAVRDGLKQAINGN